MAEVPAATPVTTPVKELIVATVGLAEDQVPPFTVEESVVVPLEQIACVPESVPVGGIVGLELIGTAFVVALQLLEFSTLKV